MASALCLFANVPRLGIDPTGGCFIRAPNKRLTWIVRIDPLDGSLWNGAIELVHSESAATNPSRPFRELFRTANGRPRYRRIGLH
jgi:hypothetical protein